MVLASQPDSIFTQCLLCLFCLFYQNVIMCVMLAILGVLYIIMKILLSISAHCLLILRDFALLAIGSHQISFPNAMPYFRTENAIFTKSDF